MTEPKRPENVTAEITTTDQVIVRFNRDDIPPLIFTEAAANQVGGLLSSQSSEIRNDSGVSNGG